MAVTIGEQERIVAAVRCHIDFGRPKTLMPAAIAYVLESVRSGFIADENRPPGFPPPCAADFLVHGVVAVCRTPPEGFPPQNELSELTQTAPLQLAGITYRDVERAVVRTAQFQWRGGVHVLGVWIECIVTPFILWAGKHLTREWRSSEGGGGWESWFNEQVFVAAELVRHALLARYPVPGGGYQTECRCHRFAEQLSLSPNRAARRCRAEHTLAAWDCEDPLAGFLWQVVVDRSSRPVDRPTTIEQALLFRFRRRRVNSFRHGMLAKFAFALRLRSGRVLACPGGGECRGGMIDPITDHCANCRRLPTTPLPSDGRCPRKGCRSLLNAVSGRCTRAACGRYAKRYRIRYQLWLETDYELRPCRLCLTCGEYRFRLDRKCPAAQAGGGNHVWQGGRGSHFWARARALLPLPDNDLA